MKVEIIYGELANLLGEHGSQALLSQTFGEEQLIRTAYPDLPAFFDEPVDLVYMGPMTERTQRLVLELWAGLGPRFREAIDRGVVFFFAGNALDLTGRTIRYEEGPTVDALNLFPFDTFCKRYDRRNEVILASFKEIPVMGFRSQFTTHTGDAGAYPFLHVEHGSGMNTATQTEGIRDGNFFATDLLGPFLILNPAFTRWLFNQAGYRGALPFEDEMEEAAAERLADFNATFARKGKAGKLLQTYLQKEKQILQTSFPADKK
jgi:CobQ-like glutamine amidotransferase family enzyme